MVAPLRSLLGSEHFLDSRSLPSVSWGMGWDRNQSARDRRPRDVVETTRANLELLRARHRGINQLLEDLEALGPIAVVGGAVRDWSTGRPPRDLDLAVDTPAASLCALLRRTCSRDATRTRLGGWRLRVDQRKIDLWALPDSWGFKRDPSLEPTFANLAMTAFFNVDAVVVELRRRQAYCAGFYEAFQRRILDIRFDTLPVDLAVTAAARSLVLASEHRLQPSPRLRRFLWNLSSERALWPLVEEEQQRRYGEILVPLRAARRMLQPWPDLLTAFFGSGERPSATHPRAA